MANLTEQHEKLAAESKWDFSDLSALFINCTLKRSPEVSNTRALADLTVAIMQRNGVSVEVIRAVDHQIATGVYPDMTEHGWERDDWPQIFDKVIAADILVVLSPIWLGEKSSVCLATPWGSPARIPDFRGSRLVSPAVKPFQKS
jgi:hypothetical protein